MGLIKRMVLAALAEVGKGQRGEANIRNLVANLGKYPAAERLRFNGLPVCEDERCTRESTHAEHTDDQPLPILETALELVRKGCLPEEAMRRANAVLRPN